MSEKRAVIICKNVWKVFGADPESVINETSDGMSKQELLEQTGHIIAVKDASFEVFENEIFVIMGLSGSGKSTLVRLINRLIEPTKGTILIDGVDVSVMNHSELREVRRHKLSMVFQNFGLLPHRTVLDNIAFGLEIRGENHKERQERVAQALEVVGLKGWENSRISELSGGMQQRVGLARALATNPEVILMDEPFSALDPLIRRQMQDEFINLSEEMKRTVVFITHDLMEALKLGDRIAIMKDGEIVQIGTPQEIVAQPADDYVSEFVQDVPLGQVFTVMNVMEDVPVMVRINHTPERTIEKMVEEQVTVAFVVDGSGRMKGIATLEKVLSAARSGITRMEEIIQEEYPSAAPETPLDQVLSLVAEGNVPIAVVDHRNRLLGIVNRANLISSMQSADLSDTADEDGKE